MRAATRWKSGKAVGIPVEAWRRLREMALEFLDCLTKYCKVKGHQRSGGVD